MALRYVKILLVAFIAFMCLVYATQNLVNLEAALWFADYVTSMKEHTVYPDSLGPPVTSAALQATVLGIIVAGEYLAGVVSAWGAWRLFAARGSDAADFNAAKGTATLGAGIALLVWFGLFTAIGGAWFQFWQTDLGDGSLMGAFQYAAQIGIVILFVNLPDR